MTGQTDPQQARIEAALTAFYDVVGRSDSGRNFDATAYESMRRILAAADRVDPRTAEVEALRAENERLQASLRDAEVAAD